MSSGSDRDRPYGVIRQGTQIVGSVCIPECSDTFIREFNHCYGQLRLEVTEPVETLHRPTTTNPHTFRLPTWFRHVWHSRNVDNEGNDQP